MITITKKILIRLHHKIIQYKATQYKKKDDASSCYGKHRELHARYNRNASPFME